MCARIIPIVRQLNKQFISNIISLEKKTTYYLYYELLIDFVTDEMNCSEDIGISSYF